MMRRPSWAGISVPLACLVGSFLAAVLATLLAEELVVVLNAVVVAALTVVAVHNFPRPRSVFALGPVGLMVAFFGLASGFVPILWAAGLATPWVEIRGNSGGAIALTTSCYAAFVAGVVGSQQHRRRLPTVRLETRDAALGWTLVVTLLSCIAGYLLLAGAAGGPTALLYTLADRRDLLAGTGPLRVPVLLGAVGAVHGVLHVEKSRANTVLTWANGLAFTVATLLTGARFTVIALLLALLFAAATVRGTGVRALRSLVLLAVAVVPASTLYGYRVRTGLTYGVEVQFVDSSSLRNSVASYLDPFVRGGLDTLRTTGVLAKDLTGFRLDLDYLLGSVANVVPRSLWPGKPPGSATQFSEQFFPISWAQGTGVPPSLFAEMVVSAGLLGGLAALVVVGFALTRTVVWSLDSHTVFVRLLTPFLASCAVSLAKGGSDSLVRVLTLDLLACAVVAVFALMARTRVVTLPADGDTAPGEPHPATARRTSARR